MGTRRNVVKFTFRLAERDIMAGIEERPLIVGVNSCSQMELTVPTMLTGRSGDHPERVSMKPEA